MISQGDLCLNFKKMKKKPSKANLFRFVTLRNPQLLSTEEKKRGFVFFPSAQKSESAFLNDIDDEEENDQNEEKVEDAGDAFGGKTKKAKK